MWFIVDSDQGILFTGITYGVWGWAFFHNLLVSIVLYKTRDASVSNALKIVFNLSGVGKAVTAAATALVPYYVNETSCRATGYLGMLFNVSFRVSLIAFLLWRLRQIERNRYDMIIGCVLTFLSTAFQMTNVFLRNINLGKPSPDGHVHACARTDKDPSSQIFWTYFAVGVATDLYVSGRLVYILRKANANAKLVSSNMRRPHKRTLFTAVMYWNFVRAACAILYDIVSGVTTQLNQQKKPVDPAAVNFFFAVTQTALSYAITADAEIVRVVEGRKPFDPKTSGSTGSAPSKSPRTASTSAKSFGSSPTSTVYKQGANGTEEKGTVYASMKRLSFFEWASVVTGFGRRNSRSNLREAARQEEEEEETDAHENVVEKVSDRNASADLEQGDADAERRGSTFSGETVTNAGRPTSTESVGQAM